MLWFMYQLWELIQWNISAYLRYLESNSPFLIVPLIFTIYTESLFLSTNMILESSIFTNYNNNNTTLDTAWVTKRVHVRVEFGL